MKFDVIINSFSKKHFPIVYLEDGTPCIVGDDSCKVFLPTGGHTVTHPYSEPGKHLCEVHPGDFIGTCDTMDGTHCLNSYRVDDVSGSHVLYTNAVL